MVDGRVDVARDAPRGRRILLLLLLRLLYRPHISPRRLHSVPHRLDLELFDGARCGLLRVFQALHDKVTQTFLDFIGAILWLQNHTFVLS